MRRNKKFYVYMMLFVVLIAQLAFSGKALAGTDAAASVDKAEADTQADGTVALYNSDNLSENTNVAAFALEAGAVNDNEAQQAQVEPRIVYNSTLAPDG